MMSRTPKQCVEEILENGMENFIPPIRRYHEPSIGSMDALNVQNEYLQLLGHHQEESDMWMAVIREMASQLTAAKAKHKAATNHLKTAKVEMGRALAQAEEDEMVIREAHMKVGNELGAVKEELERVSLLYEHHSTLCTTFSKQILDLQGKLEVAKLDVEAARRERDSCLETATGEVKEYLELLSRAHLHQARLEKELEELKPGSRTAEYGTPLNSEDLRESKDAAGTAEQADVTTE